ncbi:hypothetical protein QMK19_00415 [Streptomyces sp. H10-C2]|uniref:hypothetical protein n=1 Tax=unclassified Streptomyces TaxID=2593676 RepID=UPI0024B8B1AB|nr:MULTISPECIES: hypothetical protein [unclassified Streptomyces]MDJ0340366.1 hypothetical protein [Streptomyces sp. PH10-H1]MDJ0368186.1 hypothetical protein [Streptomyces sp. H10-C2]
MSVPMVPANERLDGALVVAPESAAHSAVLRSLSAWSAFGRPVCPGCKGRFASWTWVEIDGLRVLTHDGDLICPRDRSFGYPTSPEIVPAPVCSAVAA